MEQEIIEQDERFRTLDPAEIIKAGDSAALEEITSEVTKILEWQKDFFDASDYRQQLPEDRVQAIKQEFDNAYNYFSDIINLRRDNVAELVQQKQDRISTVKNYYRSLYNQFVQDYRAWRIENSGEDYLKQLRSTVQRAKNAEKQIITKEEEVEQRAKDTSELTKDIGLNELAKYFYQLVRGDNEWIDSKTDGNTFTKKIWRPTIKAFRGYAGAARLWMIAACISFVATFIIAFIVLNPFLKDVTSHLELLGKNGGLVFAILFAKALVLIAPIYSIRFCLKNYGSNKHLASDAIHKAKTLQTLSSYLAIPRNDDVAIREITVEVAKMVFRPTDSGFITKKDDFDSANINIGPNIKNPLG